jgi:hypothetical protein
MNCAGREGRDEDGTADLCSEDECEMVCSLRGRFKGLVSTLDFRAATSSVDLDKTCTLRFTARFTLSLALDTIRFQALRMPKK